MQQILYDKFSYDKFSYDKFYLLVWTCQQVYFDNLLVASNVIVQRTTPALTNHIKFSDYFDKFFLLTHTDEQNLYFDNFFYDKCTCSKASMLATMHLASLGEFGKLPATLCASNPGLTSLQVCWL
jgi:hypothetical protein